MSVKTCRAQRRRICFGRRVNHGPFFDQHFDYVQVSGGRRAPQRRRSLNSFTIKNNCETKIEQVFFNRCIRRIVYIRCIVIVANNGRDVEEMCKIRNRLFRCFVDKKNNNSSHDDTRERTL